MTTVSPEVLRDRSHAVFGNRYVAEVVKAIEVETREVGPQVTVRMIAARAGLTDGLVKLVTQRLVNAELLRRLPQDRPRAPAYHEIRDPGVGWNALVGLCALLSEQNLNSSQSSGG